MEEERGKMKRKSKPPFKPIISVIVTCHDLEDYLTDCIDSIKAQIAYPHEIILVHDGCKKFITYTDTICILVEKNIGVAKARMMGAKVATGNYLLFVDADDKLPEIFTLQLSRFVKTGNEIIYPNCVLWSSWGNSGMKNVYTNMPERIIWEDLQKQNWVLVTSLIPRNLFFELGGFKNYPIFEDWEFFQRAFIHQAPFIRGYIWLSYRQRTASRNRQPEEIRTEITQKIKDDIKIYIKKYNKNKKL